MNTVPFSVELYGGLGQCDGLVRDDGKFLALEFQVKDSIAGLVRSNLREVRVPLQDLVSVTLRRGWLGTKIIVQAAHLETLKDVPGMNQGRIELSVARKDRHAAERLVDGLHTEDGAGS
jgi:hypothetical protein